jgi:lia operon protein LiaG
MKKVVYLFVLLFIIGVVGTLVSVSASGGFSLETYSVHDQAVVKNKEISQIEIDISSSDLTVHPTSEDEITVEFIGKISKKLKKKLKLDVEENAQTLKIALEGEEQIKFNIGVLIVDTNVELLLPEKIYDSIKIDTSSGDILVKELKANETLFETSSGEIKIDDLESPKNQFFTSSGEMELSNITGNLSAESSSGDIIVENNHVTGDINANTSSGDVTVEFLNDPTSLSIDFNASSGNGEVTLDGVNFEERSENKIRGQIGSGDFSLSVQTSSGDFYLK